MFPEVAEECDINETFPKALWKKACELGFVGVFIDEAYGGQAWVFWKMSSSWRNSAGWMRVCWSCPYNIGLRVHTFIWERRAEEKYLPLLTKGEAIMEWPLPNRMLEAIQLPLHNGSKGEGYYVINGNKMFITNGSIADFIIVLCLTNENEKVNPNGRAPSSSRPTGRDLKPIH